VVASVREHAVTSIADPKPPVAQVLLADIHRLAEFGSVGRAGLLTQTLPWPSGFMQSQSGPKPPVLNIVDFVAANNKRIATAKMIATTSPLARFAPKYRRELKGTDGLMTRSRFAALAVGAAPLVAGTMREVQVRKQRLRYLIPEQRPEDVKHRPMGSSRDARSPSQVGTAPRPARESVARRCRRLKF
jgi:hypothetical protein